MIIPLYKKGDANAASNYRGISQLHSAYKVYTEILYKRLEREVFAKGILPEGQAGFRKERSTMDNIFVLDYVVQSPKVRKEKTYALFVDLKAAFDMVNRKKLRCILEQAGVSNYVIERIKGL